jgi:hypothetical protein
MSEPVDSEGDSTCVARPRAEATAVTSTLLDTDGGVVDRRRELSELRAAAETAEPGNGGTGYGRPNVPVPPENPGAGRRSGPTGLYYGESSPKEPPKLNAIPALNQTGTQQPGDGPAAAEYQQRLPVKPKFPAQSEQVPGFGRPAAWARGPRVVTPLGPQPATQRSLFTGLAERASLRDGG